METFLSGNLDQVPVEIISPLSFRTHLGSCQTPRSAISNLILVLTPPRSSYAVVLTCWRKYEQLPKPQSSIVRTRWRPSERRGGTRRHSHAFGRDQRYLTYVSTVVLGVGMDAAYGSLGRGHHG